MKIKYIVLLFLITVIGCSDWLNVSPRQEIKQDDLFETEEGYKYALIGVYIMMAEGSLYGRNMSFFFTDYLSRLWTPTEAIEEEYEIYKNLSVWNFNNSKTEAIIETIWKSYYTAIVQLNNILDNIDDSKDLFRNNNYDIIKGEALGLRAFLHLDLLRLFGPIPDASAAGKIAIPYPETMTKNPNELISISYQKVVENILRDLDAAEKFLLIDPLVEYENIDLNKSANAVWEGKPNDVWQLARQLRFNYYAVKATKARCYNWIGDKENAIKYAKEVIESEKFRLTNAYDYTSGTDYGINLVMLSEHIFGLQNSDHQSVISSYLTNSDAKLTQTETFLNQLYENNTADIRFVPNRYWERKVHSAINIKNHFLKYTGSGSISAANKIPVIRLSEMYLILIERLPLGEIDEYIDEFILARNLSQSIKGTLTTEEAVLKRVELETIKEFFGEGQIFYFYKRHKYTTYSWPEIFNVPSDYTNYEIPKPSGQIVFE